MHTMSRCTEIFEWRTNYAAHHRLDSAPSLDQVQEIVQAHHFLFICGLHRSGTTLLFRMLREHPLVSGFENNKEATEWLALDDEGQYLQTVYPPGVVFGGPGKFAFAPEAHLTEDSELLTPENKARLAREWFPFWDLNKRYLLEKSPPNLIMTRFGASSRASRATAGRPPAQRQRALRRDRRVAVPRRQRRRRISRGGERRRAAGRRRLRLPLRRGHGRGGGTAGRRLDGLPGGRPPPGTLRRPAVEPHPDDRPGARRCRMAGIRRRGAHAGRALRRDRARQLRPAQLERPALRLTPVFDYRRNLAGLGISWFF